MKRIPNQKRNQLILTSLAVAVVLAAVWFLGIRALQRHLANLNEDRKTAEGRLAQVLETKKNSAQIEEELLVASNRLRLQEEDMASGDFYASMVSAIKKFKQRYNVDIPQFNKPGNNAVDMNMLPKFPYRQFTVAIAGTGYFYDIGQFVADFENEFPASRILNLEIAPISPATPEDREKLSFKMDIVSLTLPGTAGTPGKL